MNENKNKPVVCLFCGLTKKEGRYIDQNDYPIQEFPIPVISVQISQADALIG